MKTINREYSLLFNEITNVSKDLNQLSNDISTILSQLMRAQQLTEEMFLEDEQTASCQ